MNENLGERGLKELLHTVTDPFRMVREAHESTSGDPFDQPWEAPSVHIDPLANLNSYDEYIGQLIVAYPEKFEPYAAHLQNIQTMDEVPAALLVIDMVLNPDSYPDQLTQ